ncbi:sugar O-acetyltransferase [Leuconostoc gelidum subsp. gelidum]|uniref:sugar O-acetyltransferase n=1 Tax=Leuconostoc gelidum TaxID=1244 RepID=UPI001CC57D94|nr:sugar O-acetyltransferase [Leuconostoc gelidum]MBZ6013859.1 sugar O-acetyltransferase [Leuconostoc gelidum subsp. gelidum]
MILVKKFNVDEIERLKKKPIKQKILDGDWYQYGDEIELQRIIKKSSKEIQSVNEIARTNFDLALSRLKKISPNIHASAEIYFPISGIEYPKNLFIGENTFINVNLQILSAGKVTIGNNCFIGPNCSLYTPNHHPYDKILRRAGWQYDGPISIGDDCWFGGNVTILPSVNLGSNVVVGAGSVVTKSFGNDVMIAGNPARVLKCL